MGQYNLLKANTPELPGLGRAGFFVKINNAPFLVLEDGTEVPFLTNSYLENLLGNGLIQSGTYTQNVNEITVNPDWIWRIANTSYQKQTTSVFNVVPAAVNFTRIDLISGNNAGEVIITQGTEVEDPAVALPPSVPANNVGLFLVFVSNSGISSFENFALSSFVRFDINNQGLSNTQRQNARLNIQALARDVADTHTGTLTQNGQLVINQQNAIVIRTGEDGTASSQVVDIQNTLGGGMRMTPRGNVVFRSRGDSLTGYAILECENNNSVRTRVFGVLGTDGYTEIGRSAVPVTTTLLNVFGKIQHADGVNPTDSATVGQVNAAATSLVSKSSNSFVNFAPGSRVFVFTTPSLVAPFFVGQRLRAVANFDTNQWSEGKVSFVSTTQVQIEVDLTTGVGTTNGWVIGVAGQPGVDGTTHFRGVYTSLANLEAAVLDPVPIPGDYAHVDEGVGTNVKKYIWDNNDSTWVLGSGGVGVVIVSPPLNKNSPGELSQFAFDANFGYMHNGTEWKSWLINGEDFNNA